VPYDWALVDFEKSKQLSEGFLWINRNERIPALIDRGYGVAVAESGGERKLTMHQKAILCSSSSSMVLVLHLPLIQPKANDIRYDLCKH